MENISNELIKHYKSNEVQEFMNAPLGDPNMTELKARSNGNAGYKEPADKWHFSGTILPEKNKAVLTYDPTEEDEREKFCVTYIYLDPKGRPHWDMHLDKLVWWRELPNKPEG